MPNLAVLTAVFSSQPIDENNIDSVLRRVYKPERPTLKNIELPTTPFIYKKKEDIERYSRVGKTWTKKETKTMLAGNIPKGRTRQGCIRKCQRMGIPTPKGL